MTNEPFLPITRPTIDEATIAGVAEVLRSGWITSGPKVLEFEAALSALFNNRPVRVMSSATGALEIALQLANVGPGDEVITTPLSWVATANVIVRAGARPVFVDIDPVTRNMDPALIEAAITPRTRAILPVDLAGLPFDRDAVYDIAQRRGLRVIEDAAQSMGANWKGKLIGSFGDLICISFHANKNLTSAEGGCIVLNDAAEAKRCTLLRLQGVERLADGEMEVTEAGGKHNLTDIAARIGLGQMPSLAAFTQRRRELVRRYYERFNRALGFELQLEEYEQSCWHMFQPILPQRNGKSVHRGAFIEAMKKLGIGVGVHYPAMHLFALYRALGYGPGDFPHSEHAGAGIVTLPLFPLMRDTDVDRVCAACTAVLGAQ
jgi:dTDP-4-amino-4,6-dideoxygalactose transaminase